MLGGYRFEALYSQDALGVLSGGKEHGWGRSRKLDFSLFVDLGEAADMAGATAYARWSDMHGAGVSGKAGDIQIASNIESERRHEVAALWFEQTLQEGSLRFKLGKVDANSEFAAVQHGAEFLNSSFGFSPTVLAFPTFPDPAFSASAFWTPVSSVTLKAGVFDGATQAGRKTGSHGVSSTWDEPTDQFLVSEAVLRWGEDLQGSASVGAWRHTGDFTRFDGASADDASGNYMVLEQEFLRTDSSGGGPQQVVAGFLQLGSADQDVAPMAGHQGLGVVWKNFVPRQQLGLGLTRVELSDEPGAGFGYRHETAIEAFWRVKLTDRLVIKPDVQYIIHPGGVAGREDALIAGCRVELRL